MIEKDLQHVITAYEKSGFPAYSSLTPENLRELFNKAMLPKISKLPNINMQKLHAMIFLIVQIK